jgi:hypothetical protein
MKLLLLLGICIVVVKLLLLFGICILVGDVVFCSNNFKAEEVLADCDDIVNSVNDEMSH